MSRIVSFALYMCVRCRQIHLRPVHGSISTYQPTDLCADKQSGKTCVACHFKQSIECYLLVGTYRSGSVKIEWLYPVIDESQGAKQSSLLFNLLNIFASAKRVPSPIASYPFFED